MRQLPVIKIGETKYFVDARLNQLREVGDPGAVEKMEASEAWYVKNFGSGEVCNGTVL